MCGQGILTISGGRVCEEFDEIHSEHAHKMLQDYFIGDLEAREEVGRTAGMWAGGGNEHGRQTGYGLQELLKSGEGRPGR